MTPDGALIRTDQGSGCLSRRGVLVEVSLQRLRPPFSACGANLMAGRGKSKRGFGHEPYMFECVGDCDVHFIWECGRKKLKELGAFDSGLPSDIQQPAHMSR
jgi:hypothetical protein